MAAARSCCSARPHPSAFKFALVGLRPTVSSLVVSNLLVVATVYSWLLGTFAAVGDVHGADPQGLALAQSRLQLMQPLAGLVCPRIGAKLATISVRIPYLLAAAAYSVQTLVVLGLPETLAKAGRKVVERGVAAERPAALHPRHPAARAGAHDAAERAVGGALPAVDGDHADPAR